MVTGYMARYNASPARTAVGEYVEIALKYGLTPTQLALAWCHQRSCVTSTIIGATSAEQLKVTAFTHGLYVMKQDRPWAVMQKVAA